MSSRHFNVRLIDESLEEYISIAGEGLLSSDREVWTKYVDRIGKENLRGVYDGDRIVGGLAFYRMGQYFGGKPLSCAGFSGVAISPADRGDGVCRQLLNSVLKELHQEGVPLASLYASTQSLYRSVGFEHSGAQTQYSIPLQSIRCEDRSLSVHRFLSPPLEKLNLVANLRGERSNGNLCRTTGLWQRLIDPYGGQKTITYLIGDLESPEGYAIFRNGERDGGVPQALVSTDVAANTPDALRRLLTLVRDHRSMCDSFEWFGPPNDALHFLADEQLVSIKHLMRWMLRIVDLPKALEGRGYPRSFSGQLHLDIHDPLLTENSGRWLLTLDAGKATVEKGGNGSLAMDIRFLSPLYSSFYSAEELSNCGVLDSQDDSQVALATQLFAGPAPWLSEIF